MKTCSKKILKTGSYEISIFDEAKKLIEECFPKHLFTKYKATKIPTKTRGIKKKILKTVKELTKSKGSFNIAELLTEVARKEKVDPLKALKTLKELINKNLQPIHVNIFFYCLLNCFINGFYNCFCHRFCYFNPVCHRFSSSFVDCFPKHFLPNLWNPNVVNLLNCNPFPSERIPILV